MEATMRGTISTDELARVVQDSQEHPGGYDVIEILVYGDGTGEVRTSADNVSAAIEFQGSRATDRRALVQAQVRCMAGNRRAKGLLCERVPRAAEFGDRRGSDASRPVQCGCSRL
jgi:hypothetical protein